MSDSDHRTSSPDPLLKVVMPALAPGEIILGELKSLDDNGNVLVDYDCNPDLFPQTAVSTLAVTRQHVGRQVALLFASGDLRRPVIMGFIHNPLDDLLEHFIQKSVPQAEPMVNPANTVEPVDQVVRVDGRQIVIEGQDEVVLKCGEASITLSKSGKISLRGKYLISRASEVNRILGGSVQVN